MIAAGKRACLLATAREGCDRDQKRHGADGCDRDQKRHGADQSGKFHLKTPSHRPAILASGMPKKVK